MSSKTIVKTTREAANRLNNRTIAFITEKIFRRFCFACTLRHLKGARELLGQVEDSVLFVAVLGQDLGQELGKHTVVLGLWQFIDLGILRRCLD